MGEGYFPLHFLTRIVLRLSWSYYSGQRRLRMMRGRRGDNVLSGNLCTSPKPVRSCREEAESPG